MKYSRYQEAIFAFCQGRNFYDPPVIWDQPLPEIVDFNFKNNAVVEAVAGSGKTSTIVKCLEFVKPEFDDFGTKLGILFLAFNKHIAEELSRRVPAGVTAATLNSTGWGICKANLQGVKMDINKNENILRTLYPTDKDTTKKVFYQIKNQVSKMVGLMKSLNILEKPQELQLVADKYDVEIPEIEDANFDFFKTVWEVFNIGIEHKMFMDFDDQIFHPVHNNWKFPSYAWVFGDEAQDWSPIQIELVRRLGTNGRIVAVGDRHQSIYGFRGADPDAIQNIICALDAVTLPLSICYRCPDAIIAEARKLVPHIENPECNPKGEGIVKRISTEYFVDNVRDGDYVLCRTTAPLVKRCLQQIRMGKKATVKGKDLGRGLLNLISSLTKNDYTSSEHFLEMLGQYRAVQMLKLKAASREQEASNVEDRCDTLEALALDCNNVREIISKIEKIFSDDAKDGIIFLTGHRAKGLETKRIWFLRDDLCPHPKSTKDWQIIQEDNLRYVIITRAMAELYYVDKEKGEK